MGCWAETQRQTEQSRPAHVVLAGVAAPKGERERERGRDKEKEREREREREREVVLKCDTMWPLCLVYPQPCNVTGDL